jgi:membrane-associated phospholipid phosphatase
MGVTSSDMRAIWPGALLVVYLAATEVLLLDRPAGNALLLHTLVLAAIATATWMRNVRPWLRAWAPLFALPFLYSEMPALIRAAGHSEFFDATVVAWEQAIFGAQPAEIWAARWHPAAMSELLHLAYLSYYGIIVSVPIMLYLSGRQRDFADTVFVLMLTFIVCCACYIAFPVSGPRYLWAAPASLHDGPTRLATLWLLEAGSSRGTAFPSSHVAVAVTQTILALRYLGRPGWVIALVTIGLACGAVYGGFHFAVDVIAGAIVGSAIAGLGLVVTSMSAAESLQANATAPT